MNEVNEQSERTNIMKVFSLAPNLRSFRLSFLDPMASLCLVLTADLELIDCSKATSNHRMCAPGLTDMNSEPVVLIRLFNTLMRVGTHSRTTWALFNQALR